MLPFSLHTVDFPLLSTHSGLMSGSGGTGLFLWGSGRRLILTVGQGDVWDHRGGMTWGPEQNFAAIRVALEKNDQEEIDRIFAEKTLPGIRRPTLLPLGRVELLLPAGWRLDKCSLDLTTGILSASALRKGETALVSFAVSSGKGRHFACSGLPENTRIKVIPAYRLSSEMAERKIRPPRSFAGKGFLGFLQPLPVDSSVSLLLKQTAGGFEAVCLRGAEQVEELFKTSLCSYSSLARAAARWWRAYWRDIPEISIGDADLMHLYYLGLFKFGCMTDPAGPPPGLQGSWIEDFGLPPWQGDYHFNINFQMCVTPGLAAGKFSHVKHAFGLLLSWKELMSRNARFFAGIGDGYMIPHAVDDRCTCMGKFWTGCIDHGCAAWVGHLMYRYCLFAADMDFLKEEVVDFLRRVLRVFFAMMTREKDGTLSLPVSISPEYNASQMNAWGKNSSFQLAAVHAVCLDLIEAAELLGEKPDPLCLDIEKNLPAVTLAGGRKGKQEIALWEGQTLEYCHRHHSHLAGLTPFGTLDPRADFVENSDLTWTTRGMGEWAGWSFPWASSLRTRLNNPGAAVQLLKIWKMCYTNPAGTSLYMPPVRGLTLTPDFSVMQMDAEMGCVSAVADLFAHCDRKELHFFQGVPRELKKAAFKNMHLPYGITASGRMTEGRKFTVELVSSMDVTLTCAVAGGTPELLRLRKGEPVILKKTLSVPPLTEGRA